MPWSVKHHLGGQAYLSIPEVTIHDKEIARFLMDSIEQCEGIDMQTHVELMICDYVRDIIRQERREARERIERQQPRIARPRAGQPNMTRL